MHRDEIYHLIDQERQYQNCLSGSRTDGSQKSVGDYLTMLSHYLRKAQDRWVKNPGDTLALGSIRKIAGIAVRCMEDHGAPDREKPPQKPGAEVSDPLTIIPGEVVSFLESTQYGTVVDENGNYHGFHGLSYQPSRPRQRPTPGQKVKITVTKDHKSLIKVRAEEKDTNGLP